MPGLMLLTLNGWLNLIDTGWFKYYNHLLNCQLIAKWWWTRNSSAISVLLLVYHSKIPSDLPFQIWRLNLYRLLVTNIFEWLNFWLVTYMWNLVVMSISLPMAEQVGCGTPCLLWNMGVREVVGSRPGRGNSKESFSSNQETGKVFSPEMPFYSKF